MSIEFAGHSVPLGQKSFTSIVVDCPHDRVEVPLFLVGGVRPGPVFFFISGEHGTELVGPETIRRFVEQLNPEELAGTVVAVPVANPYAMRTKAHSFPYDKWAWFHGLNNMSADWPGKKNGTPSECVAHVIYEEIIKRADAVASLHNTNCRAYLGYRPGDDVGRKLCLDYGRISFIYPHDCPGGCVKCANETLGIPAALVEWAPLRHVNQLAVRESVIGLQNMLKSMGMLEGEPEKISDQFVVDYDRDRFENTIAVDDGVLVREKAWGQDVQAGEVIARLYDLYKYREIQVVTAGFDGLLNDTGPNPQHLSTFFMHTDSVCKGERISSIVPVAEHIQNPGGDAWRHMLIGGPGDGFQCPFQ